VIALVAGARRTNTAYSRFLWAERSADGEVFLTGPPDPAQVRRLAEVVDSATLVLLSPVNGDFDGVVVTDPRLGDQINRFKFLAGRPLDPNRADEAVVGFVLARNLHLHVGSPLTMRVATGAQASSPVKAATFRVVGIEATPGEFPPRTANNILLAVYLSPAFLRTPLGAQATAGAGGAVGMFVRLRHGPRDTTAFQADLYRLAGGTVGFTAITSASNEVRRSMHFAAVALLLMAAFAGLTSALVILQLLSRRSGEDVTDHATLRTLGMTSGQLFASGMIRVAAMAAAGAVTAAAVSVAASPLLPRGTARIAEPRPGYAFDATTIGLGAAGVLFLVGLLGAVALSRSIRPVRTTTAAETSVTHVSVVPRILGVARLPLVMATGARLALQTGRGRTAVPVRATLVAAAVGVGAMAAAMTFGASLTHLVSTPALYGGTFDADVTSYGNSSDLSPLVAAVRADPAVEAVSVASTGIPFQVGSVHFDASAIANVQGSVSPTVVDGRLPAAADEIFLGSRTMSDLHAHLGQTIPVTVTGVTTHPMSLRVVGRGVFAPIAGAQGLGRGAMVPVDTLAAMAPFVPPGFQAPPPGDVFVRFRPGTGKAASVAELGRRLADAQALITVPTQPSDVANFGQVRNLPQILAGLLGLVAAVTMAYLLVTGIQRRRRDLAVLKSIGLVPRQVSAAIAWQATTIVVVAAVIGLPLGLAAGRSAWAVVAGQMGVVIRPTVPLLLILGLVPAAVLIANLVAAGPAVAAGRIRPASVLRSE
jgi:ABC-type lipoprotein release transport system permease subunit